MFSRRNILAAATSAAALTPFSAALAQAAAAAAPTTPAGKLNALFDTFMTENLDMAPEFATALGIDVGPRAHQRGEVSDNSVAGIAKAQALNHSQRLRLEAFDAGSLTGLDRVNYDIILYGLRNQDEAAKRFPYNGGGAGAPYAISQLTGLYTQAPDFLDSQQPIETAADAEAYLSRLHGFATSLDNELQTVDKDVAMGVIPPDFALDRTLTAYGKLREPAPDKSVMTASLERRTKAKNIPGDWAARATKIVAEEVYPALDRQIAKLKEMRAHATHDAGVWKLPDGEAYYAASLKFWTTSDMPPAEIHRTGLAILKELEAGCDAQMRKIGLTEGTVGERYRVMYNDPKYRYPNTDEGKAKLLVDLNTKVAAVQARLPQWFGTLPKAHLEIKRIPPYTEGSQPGGYYNQGSLEGSRPGAYYINLRDTAEVPSWTLSTLTYHEGIPGHHMQISLQQEAPIPLIRKVSFFSAYMEGWALYSEQLADEMGMYDDDPAGKIGYYHDAMLRAARLVMDSGIHSMRWTREQAVKFFVDTLGDQEASAISEVERYCVWPGQACAYMLGKIDWLKNRAKAKAALGAKFDIRKFHDAGLLMGAMPLAVLDTVIDRYIVETKKA